MDHISDFLSRYLSPYLKREQTKETIAVVCSDVLGITLSPEKISIRGEVCVVAGHPSVKHQIFLRQEEIIQKLHQIKTTAHIRVLQ
jgi:hypothetical protein